MKKSKQVIVLLVVSFILWGFEMITGCLSSVLPVVFFSGLWSLLALFFVVIPLGMEWLKGESNDCD